MVLVVPHAPVLPDWVTTAMIYAFLALVVADVTPNNSCMALPTWRIDHPVSFHLYAFVSFSSSYPEATFVSAQLLFTSAWTIVCAGALVCVCIHVEWVYAELSVCSFKL